MPSIPDNLSARLSVKVPKPCRFTGNSYDFLKCTSHSDLDPNRQDSADDLWGCCWWGKILCENLIRINNPLPHLKYPAILVQLAQSNAKSLARQTQTGLVPACRVRTGDGVLSKRGFSGLRRAFTNVSNLQMKPLTGA
jgi:hypothetical protein